MRFTEEFSDGRTIDHTIDTSAIAAVTVKSEGEDQVPAITVYFLGGHKSEIYPPTAKDGRDFIDMLKAERREFIGVCWTVKEAKYSIYSSPYSVISVESELGRGNTGILRVVFDHSSMAEFAVENVHPDKLIEEGIDSNTSVFMTLKQHIEHNLMSRLI